MARPRRPRLALALALLLSAASLAAAANGGAGADAGAARLLAPPPDLPPGALQRFAQLLRFRTLTGGAAPPGEWGRLDAWLRAEYSDVFGALGVETLGDADALSYLLTLPGTDPRLAPVLFVAHSDVVPVTAGTDGDWTHPPFSGAVADGFVWGRGALDVKVLMALQLEALRSLLAGGFRPARGLMLAIGADEEVGGARGAAALAAVLAARSTRLSVVVDEGPAVALDGLPPLHRRPVALVATAEKLAVGVDVTLRSRGGHASMPPTDGSAVAAQLGRLLSALSVRPPPLQLVPPTSDFVAALGRLAPAGAALLIRGARAAAPLRWLLAAALSRAQPETAAMVRTTVAVTCVRAGTADNVLPQTASVGLNVRLLPGDTPAAALAYVRRALGRDAATASVELARDGGAAVVMRVADAGGPHFAVLASAIQRAWRPADGGELPVLPVLMPAMTDSRHFLRLSRHGALRFTPWSAWRADYARLHGTDERISVADFARGLQAYTAALEGFGGLRDDGEEQQQERSEQRGGSSGTAAAGEL